MLDRAAIVPLRDQRETSSHFPSRTHRDLPRNLLLTPSAVQNQVTFDLSSISQEHGEASSTEPSSRPGNRVLKGDEGNGSIPQLPGRRPLNLTQYCTHHTQN